jgi:hypothetical protein
LIRVDLEGKVAENIAKNINVEVAQIPASVKVPVGVAAIVCHTAADLLAAQAASGTGSCTANRPSGDLERVVLDQIKGKAAAQQK